MAIIKDYRGEWDVASVKVNFSNGDQRIYSGCKPLIVPNNYKYKHDIFPKKGDLINIDGKEYRVLKITDTVAEVLCMYSPNTSIKFDTNSSYNNTYEGKNIDTYCNSTFYDGLSAAIQSAIVDKTFTQDSWQLYGGSSAIANYNGKYSSHKYVLSLMNETYRSSITRHCYCLSVQDVIDYLEVTTSMTTDTTTLTDTNIWQMFWNQSTSISQYIWLRSALASDSDYAFNVFGNSGNLDNYRVDNSRVVRPAFQIDLDKINWSIV